MPVKMFSARICSASPDVLDALWNAHVEWNRAAREQTLAVLRALRGEQGDSADEQIQWAQIARFVKTTRMHGKDLLEACAHNRYKQKSQHPLASFQKEINQTLLEVGEPPSAKPVEWFEAIKRYPSWTEAMGESWTPLDAEAEANLIKRVEILERPSKKILKGIAAAKKKKSSQSLFAQAYKNHSATFKELSSLFDKEWQTLRSNMGPAVMFDRDAITPDWCSVSRRKLYDVTIARLRSYWELLSAWHDNHHEWQERKTAFEENNTDYIRTYKPLFDNFYQENGQTTQRRVRWHKYLEFLKAYPGLTAFRGLGDGANIQLPSEKDHREYQKELLEHARRNPRQPTTAIEQKYLLRANPGLAKLHDLDQEYRDEFLRDSRERRNHDGYSLPPSFTLPSPKSHPVWLEFQRNDGYKDFTIGSNKETGSLKLKTPQGIWIKVALNGGDRFKSLNRLSAPITRDKDKYEWRWIDRQGRNYLAQIQGLKLVFKRVRDLRGRAVAPGAPLLFFSVTLTPENHVSLDTEITAAVDLGIHIPAAVTICKDDKIVGVRVIRDKDLASSHTQTLRSEKRTLSKRRRQSRRYGPPIEGNSFRFQQHINQSGDDRVKKLAEKIVSYAIDMKAGTLLVEDLKGLKARSAELRAINRSITGWLRARLLMRLEQEAVAAGIQIRKLPAYNTSRVCHRCGAAGVRYDKTAEGPKIKPVGALFVCRTKDCLIDFNADVNASMNLQKVYRKTFVKPAEQEWAVLRTACEARLTMPRGNQDDLQF